MFLKKSATYRVFSRTVSFKTKLKKNVYPVFVFFIFPYFKRWNQPSAIKVQLNNNNNNKKIEIKTIIDDIRQLIETYGSNHDEKTMNTFKKKI